MNSLALEQKNIYSAAFYSLLFNLVLLVIATLMHSGAKQVTHSSAIQIKYLPGLTKQKKTFDIPKKKSAVVEKQIKQKPTDAKVSKPRDSSNEHSSKEESLPDIVPLSEVTRFPQFLNRIEPFYPEGERSAGREAHVIAEVVVDTRGRVIDVVIIKSAGSEFDQAVLDSIKKSSFVPGYLEGKPVVVRLQIPFRFKLR